MEKEKKYIWANGYKTKNNEFKILEDNDNIDDELGYYSYDPTSSISVIDTEGNIIIPTEELESIGNYARLVHISENDIFIEYGETRHGGRLNHYRYNEETGQLEKKKIRMQFTKYSFEEYQKDNKRVAIIRCVSENDSSDTIAFLYSIDDAEQIIKKAFQKIEITDEESGIFKFTEQIKISQTESTGFIGYIDTNGNISKTIYDEYFNKERSIKDENFSIIGLRDMREEIKQEIEAVKEKHTSTKTRVKQKAIEELKLK